MCCYKLKKSGEKIMNRCDLCKNCSKDKDKILTINKKDIYLCETCYKYFKNILKKEVNKYDEESVNYLYTYANNTKDYVLKNYIYQIIDEYYNICYPNDNMVVEFDDYKKHREINRNEEKNNTGFDSIFFYCKIYILINIVISIVTIHLCNIGGEGALLIVLINALISILGMVILIKCIKLLFNILDNVKQIRIRQK